MATLRNENHSNSNQMDNSNNKLNAAANVNNLASNRNSGVFLTLKLSYSPTGELVIDMEPAHANNGSYTTTTTVDAKGIGAPQTWVYYLILLF